MIEDHRREARFLLSSKIIKLFALPLAAVMLALCGCSGSGGTSGSDAQPGDPSAVVTVYCDDRVTVEAGDMRLVDGQDCCLLRLKLLNTGDKSIALSSALCVRLTADGQALETVALPDGYQPVDGLVRPGGTADGYIAFASSALPEMLSAELALDFAADDWITFVYSP